MECPSWALHFEESHGGGKSSESGCVRSLIIPGSGLRKANTKQFTFQKKGEAFDLFHCRSENISLCTDILLHKVSSWF